jgi:DnaK suppressor protein
MLAHRCAALTQTMHRRRKPQSQMGAVTARLRTDIARLESERQELLLELEHLQAELHNLAEPTADEADADAYEREKTWALITGLHHKLESVEHALQLAQSGAYGICQSCHGTIDPARLEILPQATLCLKCQQEFERQNRRARQ